MTRKIFGYGGATPAPTPTLDLLSGNGVRFRNVWAMPECSPSRAMFFEGRHSFRTNVRSAIVDGDLANSQVSPYEITTPKILKQANYTSAMFGKFHLAGPGNNPYGYGTPLALGWDHFFGYMDAGPLSLDTTAGGVAPSGTYPCGFVPEAAFPNGADSGACYFADSRRCRVLTRTGSAPTPGRTCLEQGGVFVPKQSCGTSPPAGVTFNNTNGYYVWPAIINNRGSGAIQKLPLTDTRARKYSPAAFTDAAVTWIKGRSPNRPWMATLSYSSIHTPYQRLHSTGCLVVRRAEAGWIAARSRISG